MTTPDAPARAVIRAELEAARIAFHALIDSLSDPDLRRQSLNPGWRNGEILFHMIFAFILILTLGPMVRVWGRLPRNSSKWFAQLLNSMTGFFNWFNAVGPRAGGRLFSRAQLAKLYDWVHAQIMRMLESIGDDEWGRGMYYPHRWDALFSEYMTLAKLLVYPTLHFKFHLSQISH